MKVISTITGCLGIGIKELKESIKQIFEYHNNDKKLELILREIQNTALRELESLTTKCHQDS